MVKPVAWLFLTVLVVAVAAFGYRLADANRFKPEIEALVARHSNSRVLIEGDVQWQLWPSLTLQVDGITVTRRGLTIAAQRLALEVDLTAMWQDIDGWRVRSLTLSNVSAVRRDATTLIHSFVLTGPRPGAPAQFDLDFVDTPAGSATPTSAHARGELTYTPGADGSRRRLRFSDTTFTSDAVQGACDADLAERSREPTDLPASTPTDLLPVAALMRYDIAVDCRLDSLQLRGETFEEVRFALTNVNGRTSLNLDIADFLGGSLTTDADIDATATPVAWLILPEMQNVDSQRLVDWSNSDYLWSAPIGLTGTITMQGNTRADMLASLDAQIEFDGGQGQLDVANLKRQLQRVAVLANRADDVAGWPEVLHYSAMAGRLDIQGRDHALAFALDNLSLEAKGVVDYPSQALDLRASVTVHQPPAGSPITINPWLMDTPIPLRCRGSANEPNCKVDNDAARQVVADALQRDSDSGLRRKLEDKIETEVPEQYRQAARNLLDLIGRALE